MKTLILCGSIRSTQGNLDKIGEIASQSDSVECFSRLCMEYLGKNSKICNSDILAGAAFMAMKHNGSDATLFSLTRLFPKSLKSLECVGSDGDKESFESLETLDLLETELAEMIKGIETSEGVMLVTPVYFGDRSSVANKALQVASRRGLLKNKIFGAAAVGAKRNGGQETAVIYSLVDAMVQGALVVGNGPPTSQYGGTAVGGRRGTVAADTWGLTTSYGVGARITQVSEICVQGLSAPKDDPVRVLVLLTMDDLEQTLLSFMKKYLETMNADESINAEFVLVNALDHTIYRCLGCGSCPGSNKIEPHERPTVNHCAKCTIQRKDDTMDEIHKEMILADGILIAGLNTKDVDKLLYSYQVLVERTRFIRRDNFELTNKLITAFTLNEVGSKTNALHQLKTVTSYIRHNVPIAKPIDAVIYEGKVLDNGVEDFKNFLHWTAMLRDGVREIGYKPIEYTTAGIGGYD